MEALSLLKYWRTGGRGGDGATSAVFTEDSATKTVVTAAAENSVSPYSSDEEDGPYFDLEFALPDQETDTEEAPSAKTQENDRKAKNAENGEESESESDVEEISVRENDDDDEEGELKFALTSNECGDQNVTDELFFEGNLVSIEPSSIVLNGSEENSKFPVFLTKSATKFRVLLLKLKKSKCTNGVNLEKPEKNEAPGQGSAVPSEELERENKGKVSGKLFAVKFKGEDVPILSLFARDTSSKARDTSSKENHGKGHKRNVEDSDTNGASDERKLTKDVAQKYLKMVKPFYIRVSKRYMEKLKFSSHSEGVTKGCAAPQCPAEKGSEGVAEAAPDNLKTPVKRGKNLQAGLQVVRKHLGKNRSASAAVAADPHGKATSNRRDDSLLQLQDGIQGAILHCKRSFNASRDGESSSSILYRSASDPSHEKLSVISPKVSSASTSSHSGEANGANV